MFKLVGIEKNKTIVISPRGATKSEGNTLIRNKSNDKYLTIKINKTMIQTTGSEAIISSILSEMEYPNSRKKTERTKKVNSLTMPLNLGISSNTTPNRLKCFS